METVDRPVALVTGASSGIGAAIALRLAQEDRWRLILSGRDQRRLEAVSSATSGLPLTADLRERHAGRDLVKRAVAATGRLDLLVACAGTGWAGEFATMPPDALDELLWVDLGAVLHLVQAAIPHLTAGRGKVVVIGSVAGMLGVRNEAAYSAAKGALRVFCQALRQELGPSGVQVSYVAPAAVDTPFFARRGCAYQRAVPRMLRAEDVAELICRQVAAGGPERVLPRWLRCAEVVQVAAPRLYARLVARFG